MWVINLEQAGERERNINKLTKFSFLKEGGDKYVLYVIYKEEYILEYESTTSNLNTEMLKQFH